MSVLDAMGALGPRRVVSGALALGLALAAMGAAAAPSLRVGLATFTETQAIRTDGVPAPGEQGTLRPCCALSWLPSWGPNGSVRFADSA